MSINNDLKRAAEAVLAMDYPWEHTVRDGRLGKTSTEYARLAHPLSVRALIVENERLEAINNQMILLECNGGTAQAAINLLDERDRLRAEVAGLRTGYEAYEQVNAELKAEVERLERNRDMWKGQVERQAEELTALRKRIDDVSPFKGAPFTGPDTKCLACGGYHYGMTGLPCPKMRITAQADLPETRSGQIDAAQGQGELS